MTLAMEPPPAILAWISSPVRPGVETPSGLLIRCRAGLTTCWKIPSCIKYQRLSRPVALFQWFYPWHASCWIAEQEMSDAQGVRNDANRS